MTPPAPRGAVHALAAAAGIALASLGIAACGSEATTSTTTSPRQAAVAANADGVCPERRSRAESVRVLNALPSPVTFRVPIDQIDCSDWSGVSTPYTAFNRQSVGPGQDRTVRLEAANRSSLHRWTMSMRTVGARGEAEGSTRLYLEGGRPRAEGARVVLSAPGRACAFTGVATAPQGWRDTARGTLDTGDFTRLAVVVMGGEVGYLTCDVPGEITDEVT